mgnify:CR=1 FL=1
MGTCDRRVRPWKNRLVQHKALDHKAPPTEARPSPGSPPAGSGLWSLLLRHHFHGDFRFNVLVDPDRHLVGAQVLDRIRQQDHPFLDLNALLL